MANRRNPPKRLGERIADALTEVRDVLRGGQPLERALTVRTVEIPEPRKYDAHTVRATRQKLDASQAVFAKLLGVSVELVEHWEQGVRSPKPLACRLLDEINHDPRGFLRRHTRSSAA